MKTRRLHRVIGITLLLPFLGWSITGIVFFVKPGYGDAYAALQPKTYSIGHPLRIVPDPAWQEFRYLRTILGEHLVVRTNDGWQHLEPKSAGLKDEPSDQEFRKLLMDAFSTNPARYGNIVAISDATARTDTGIEVTLDWNRMNIRQRGRDTRAIDTLYRIHYLQWTGIDSVDRVLGMAGLLLLITMTILGARLAFAVPRR